MLAKGERSRKKDGNFIEDPVIVVLSHKRVSHLKEMLHQLRSARGYENHKLVVVLDGGDKTVERLVRSAVSPSALLVLEDQPDLTPAKRISFAVKSGLTWAFSVLDAPYTIVLEDDIVVSEDFLEFVAACHEKFGTNRRFRGVNGFSQVPAEEGTSDSASHVVKLNYGLGWGWSINRSTFFRILPALDLPHPEGWIWDFAIEPYIRTGFVINPIRSRIRNIGFDSTAAHTGGEEGQKLGKRIDSSFLSDARPMGSGRNNLKISNTPFTWRKDCFNLSKTSLLSEKIVYWLQSISQILITLEISSNAHVRHHSRKIRSRLLGLILQKYGEK